MNTITQRATIDDLTRFTGKAELIDGRIVELMPTGHLPNRIAFLICKWFDDYATRMGLGVAYTDNIGFRVSALSSGRETFSPDAAYYSGPLPRNAMKFIPGPPTVAVEVRSENNYSPLADLEMEAKRGDYFEAGTMEVWDVDIQENTIHVYRAGDPEQPVSYAMQETIEQVDGLPGFSLPLKKVLG